MEPVYAKYAADARLAALGRADPGDAVKAFSRALDVLSAATVGLAGIALVGLIAMMGWLVFGRYVLNDTPTWIERAATLCILAIAMPVAAVGVRREIPPFRAGRA